MIWPDTPDYRDRRECPACGEPGEHEYGCGETCLHCEVEQLRGEVGRWRQAAIDKHTQSRVRHLRYALGDALAYIAAHRGHRDALDALDSPGGQMLSEDYPDDYRLVLQRITSVRKTK